MNNQGIINLRAVQKVLRIEKLIDRLDSRGEKLMNEAIKSCGGPRYEDCVAGIQVIVGRSRKLAAYIEGLSRPQPKRRISA